MDNKVFDIINARCNHEVDLETMTNMCICVQFLLKSYGNTYL